MLLNEFANNPILMFETNSRLLESLYGIKLSRTSDLNYLHESIRKANKIIESYKDKNKTINDKEVTKYKLISDAFQSLVEYENMQRVSEIESGYRKSSKYERIIQWLTDFCLKSMEIGDSLDDAVYDAMKEYRSSKYRFPDVEVEADLRKEIDMALGIEPSDHTEVKNTIFDNYTSEQIEEAVSKMENAIKSNTVLESDDTLVDIAIDILESGDFYDPEGGVIKQRQQQAAAKYLDKMGGSALELEDDPLRDDPVKVKFGGGKGKQTKLSPAQRARIMKAKHKKSFGEKAAK